MFRARSLMSVRLGATSGYSSYNTNYNLWKNEIRYNLVEGQAGGIRTKGEAWLTTTRNGSDSTNKEYGDKIHHNIIIQTNGSSQPAIFYQQDYAQIYNNVIDQTASAKGQENWSIATRRIRSSGERDTLQAVIYNNTIYNGGSEIGDFHEGDGSANEEWYVYNNILDNMSFVFCPISYGCSSGWCSGYSDRSSQSIANLHIDRNYIYRTSGSNAIFVGNSSWPNGAYSASAWDSAKGGGVRTYVQGYDSGNLLYQGTSGANKYKTRGTHTVSGSTTLSNAGIGGNHPYKSGVTIPSYIGATNPSDNNWVDGVMSLADISVLRNGSSGDPSWVENSNSFPLRYFAINDPFARDGNNELRTNNSAIALTGKLSGYTSIGSISWVNSRGGSGSCQVQSDQWSSSNITLSEGSNIIEFTLVSGDAEPLTATIEIIYDPNM